MKVVIIEDEQRATRHLVKLIDDLNKNITVISTLSSVKEASEWFSQNELPDIIISDIQLGDGKSFDVFENLKNIPPVIFTTAYDEYALRAFKSNGIDYLLKPIDPLELENALKKVNLLGSKMHSIDFNRLASLLKEEKEEYKSRFMVKIGEKLKSIPTTEVACFYSMEGGSYLQTREKRNYNIDFTMDQLEDVLDPVHFFRVNRKLITHFKSIDTIHMWSGSRLKIELSCNYEEEVVVSRERVKEFKQWLDR